MWIQESAAATWSRSPRDYSPARRWLQLGPTACLTTSRSRSQPNLRARSKPSRQRTEDEATRCAPPHTWPGLSDDRYWYSRLAKSVIFVILAIAIAGAYVVFKVPISVFPQTDFPRVVIG